MSGRGQHDDDDMEMIPADEDSGDDAPSVPSFVKMAEFSAHCNAILSSADDRAVLASTIYMRKLLSVETNPALDLVVSKGKLVARLCDLIITGSTPAIQFEAAWAVTNISSGSSVHCEAAVGHGAHSKFLHVLANSSNMELKEQCVWGLGNIAGDGVGARDMCLGEGALDAILTCFPHHNAAAAHPPRSFLRNASWAMSNLLRGSPQPPFDDSQRDAMACLGRVFMDACGKAQGKPWACANGDHEVIVDAAWGLSYLTNGSDARLGVICEMSSPSGACPGLVDQLVECLSSPRPNERTPCLRTVGNIVTGNATHVKTVVQAGFLDQVVPLMKDAKRTLRKEACWALSNVTADTNAHKQQVIAVPECARTLLKCIGDSHDIAKEAAYVLANLFEQASVTVVTSGIAAGYLGVLLACTAKNASSSNATTQVCQEGINAVVSMFHGSPPVQDALKAQVQSCAAYPALMKLAVGETRELIEALKETLGADFDKLFETDMSEKAAMAALGAVLDGTAPPVAFGAGSGAQASAKGKTDPAGDASTSNKSAGVSAHKNNDIAAAFAPVAVAAAPLSPQEPEQPLASVELAPDNISDSGSEGSSGDDEVPP